MKQNIECTDAEKQREKKKRLKKKAYEKRKKERDDLNRPLLLQKQMQKKWMISQKITYFICNVGLLGIACVILGLATLLLSAANFGMEVFGGYFEKPMILLVNFAIPFALAMVLYLFIGRAWIAYTVTAVIAMCIALGNYFLIMIRNDPLQFIDILCLREALDITATQHYELHIGWEVIISVLACAGAGVGLFFLARWTPKVKNRLALLVTTVIVVTCACISVPDKNTYDSLTRNYEHINTWSSTQIYVSRGVLYSFTRSAMSAVNSAPEGYSEKKAEEVLAQYPQTDIPADKKVNVIAIMRESYCDLSLLDCKDGSIDFSCYDAYHDLVAESYSGKLITNGFGGNTKNAERCFLTGSYAPIDNRKPADSYVWYLREQGYTAEGAHPFDGWFYNRLNVSRYLGFDTYKFREDTFYDLTGEEVADDDVLYDVIWQMFDESDPDTPYFNFSVTYEGHGPYNYRQNKYDTSFIRNNYATADGYAMDNYLSCVYKRDQELMVLVDKLRESDRPVVLLIFGDHKPTLGSDVNNYTTAAYESFGINMDVSSEQGFIDYFSTEYVIWANDAAKAQLGIDLAGKKGPMISPCYLMNVLFDAVGWDCGSSYLQAMDGCMAQFPVVSSKGRVSVNGELSQTVPADQTEAYNDLLYIDYYNKTKAKK